MFFTRQRKTQAAGRFPLKIRDEAIAAGLALLKTKVNFLWAGSAHPIISPSLVIYLLEGTSGNEHENLPSIHISTGPDPCCRRLR